MVCVYCGQETKVINSRHQRRNNSVWRRRQCLNCSAVFTSHEKADLSSVLRVVRGQNIENFNEDFIFTELLLALGPRPKVFIDARELTSTVIKHLMALPGSPVFDTKQISKVVSATLKRFDRQAWHRYSSEHPSD